MNDELMALWLKIAQQSWLVRNAMRSRLILGCHDFAVFLNRVPRFRKKKVTRKDGARWLLLQVAYFVLSIRLPKQKA